MNEVNMDKVKEKKYNINVNLYSFLNNSEIVEDKKKIEYKKTNNFNIEVYEFDTILTLKKKISYEIYKLISDIKINNEDSQKLCIYCFNKKGNKIIKSKEFYLQYINEEENLLKKINFKELDKIIKTIKKCLKNNNIIYTCGNGGSSSLADHFTCDFIKQTNNKTNLKVKSISLASNFSLISAIANDINYDQIFSFQIEKLGKKNDILFLFSVSGNSKNLLNAVKKAKEMRIKTISFTGFNGGKLSKMSDLNLNFPIANYGIVENCHISIMHYLSQYLRNTSLKSKNFKKINF